MKKANRFKKLLLFLIIIVTLIDIIACWQYYSDPFFNNLGFFNHLFASLYLTLQLYIMSVVVNEEIVPVLLNIFRFISPLLLLTAFLNFIFSETKQFWTYKMIKWFYRDHIIFCGLNDTAILLIKDYLNNKKSKIVVIEADENIIFDYHHKGQQVQFINGNATDNSVLRKANIFKAKNVFLLTENESFNITIANNIQELYSKHPQKNENSLNVVIHLSDFYSIRIFKNFQEKKIANLDFHAFNIYQKAAALLVDKYSPDQYVPLNEKSSAPAHILIHGLEFSGENVIVESAQLYHFANLKKTQITVVDSDIIPKKQLFLKKYPFIESVVDIKFYEETDFLKPNFEIPDNISVCFICDKNDAESLLIARRYRQLFFEINFQNNKVEINNIKNPKALLINPVIAINTAKTANILNLFKNIAATTKSLNIEIENLFENVCTKKLLADDHEAVDDVAKQFHNIYMKLDSRELDTNWVSLTDEAKDFNRYPARHIAIKLRYLGAELVDRKVEKPDFDYDKISEQQKHILARMEHERWNAEKLLTGFVPGKVGFEKDFYKLLKENLKWHKDIHPWEELTKEDQHKDEMLNELKEVTNNLKFRKTVTRNP